jgi:hypothetical protein
MSQMPSKLSKDNEWQVGDADSVGQPPTHGTQIINRNMRM